MKINYNTLYKSSVSSLLFIFFCFFTLKTNAQLDTLSIYVDGVCGMCQYRIEKTAFNTKGVKDAFWDETTHILVVAVESNKFEEKNLHTNLAAVGHSTDKLEAIQSAYNALPDCCKYNDENNLHLLERKTGKQQNTSIISGMVYEKNIKGKQVPLIGATIQWKGTNIGTVTDTDGHFQLDRMSDNEEIIVNYVGYDPDTINMNGQYMVAIVLTNNATLTGVEVVHRRKSTEISFLNPIKTQMIGEKELLKAACCNLSESFETNPTVQLSYTDAITGTQQIEMLGLSGPYVQMMRESIPSIRGLSSLYGLTYVPGTWIEGIQLNLGAGSVVNGFESITGQMNVELRKPENSDQMYLNFYASEAGRLEANANFSRKINDNWSTALLLHGKYQQVKLDRNDDEFLDMPLTSQWIGLNRWKYKDNSGLEIQFGIQGVQIEQVSGQLSFDKKTAIANQDAWGSLLKTNRLEGWMKIGKVFPAKPYSSIGFQLSGVHHQQEANFGQRMYNATQNSLYANLIYQGILGTTKHNYKIGSNWQLDEVDENIMLTLQAQEMQPFRRLESVPGAFAEYTFTHLDKFTAVAGLRGDYHNNYGFFATPRLHLRYALRPSTTLRASVGRGLRTATIFAENIGIFASNRTIFVESQFENNPYQLDAEVAWNYGWNATQDIQLWQRPSTLSLDVYHTNFKNQIVVDYDVDPQQIRFYNLEGQSFSTSLQAQWDVEVLNRWDVRLAYRYNDVQTDYKTERLRKPFLSKHIAFVNTAYETNNQWKFDATVNWQSSKRIPSTTTNPHEFHMPEASPNFFLVNAQISKGWGERLEIYVGGENLLNFQQEMPIISSENPLSPYFDASLVWGPIFGRNVYSGLRYRLK
jgi:hypothetical protein